MPSITFRRFAIYVQRIVITTFISAIAITPVIHAIDAGFYSANNILFSDPNAKELCANGSSTDASTLNGNDNLQKVYNYFLGKGLTDFQAAGVVGNISQESKGNPQISQRYQKNIQDPSTLTGRVGGGNAWGLIQWDSGSRVLDYAKRAGATGPIYELSTQLDIVWWHMNNESPTAAKNMINRYKQTTTVEDAVRVYENLMEGSNSAIANRISAAKIALKYAKSPTTGGAIGNSSDPNCTGGSSGAVAGNIVQTAINYAWPDYHSAPYTTKKPSYETAIQAAVKAGKYVGGLQYPGVDCGGFITRVMQDSGADPTYGGGGNTDSQMKYLQTSGKYLQIHPKSTADMRPGDIAIRDGHTYMYVGKNPGFNSLIASASVSFNGDGWRAPMAGKEKPADPSYKWFRLK